MPYQKYNLHVRNCTIKKPERTTARDKKRLSESLKKKDSNQFVISINKINNEARVNNQVCIVFRFFLMF